MPGCATLAIPPRPNKTLWTVDCLSGTMAAVSVSGAPFYADRAVTWISFLVGLQAKKWWQTQPIRPLPVPSKRPSCPQFLGAHDVAPW